MGIFDKLVKSGTKILGDALGDALGDGSGNVADVAKRTLEQVGKTANETFSQLAGGGSGSTQSADTRTAMPKSSAVPATEQAAGGTVSAGMAEREAKASSARSRRATTGAQFKERLDGVLDTLGGYELAERIPVEEIAVQPGEPVYQRRIGMADPHKISYAIRKDGDPVLYIWFWEHYPDYDHSANQQVMAYCDRNGMKYLNFFGHLPNESGYMTDRIRKALA